MTAGLAAGQWSAANTETYVAACHVLGATTLIAAGIGELYRAEDGLRLDALDDDSAALDAAGAAAEEALGAQHSALAALRQAWRGGTGGAATEFLARQCSAAAEVGAGLRSAAAVLRALREDLERCLAAKADAAVRIDDRAAGQRGLWLDQARAVLGGAAGAGAREVVGGQIAPYVGADIATDWVTAMVSGTDAAAAAYDRAIGSLRARAPARFETPAVPAPGRMPPPRPAPTAEPAAAPAPQPATSPSAAPAVPPPIPAMPYPAPDLTPAPAVSLPASDPPARTAEPPGPDPAGARDEQPSAAPENDPVPARPEQEPGPAAPDSAAPGTVPALPAEAPDVPVPPPDPAPAAPPEPTAPVPTGPAEPTAPAGQATPCEIAADELPQVGQ